MEFQRILFLGLLIALSWFLWQEWHELHAPDEPVLVLEQQQQQSMDVPDLSSVPSTPVESGNVPSMPSSSISGSSDFTIDNRDDRLVSVETDVYKISIDRLGGNLVSLYLKEYPVSLDEPDVPYQLMNYQPHHIYEAQSGLVSSMGPDTQETGQGYYNSQYDSYNLKDYEDKLVVDLNWSDDYGLNITKRYTFERGTYLIDVEYLIDNQSSEIYQARPYQQLKIQPREIKKAGFFALPTFFGGAISGPDKLFEKLSFDDMRKSPIVNRYYQGGWIAIVEHYFVSAWIPWNFDEYFNYSTHYNSQENLFLLRQLSGSIEVAPGSSHKVGARLFSGPEITSIMKDVAPGLEYTVDYGWLWAISSLLFWVINKIHSVVGNWGWSIIIVTLMIKLVFYKLSATSYRSMANLRRLQPKLEQLKERHGSDRQKMSQAMMELYRKEKINPLGGCLPILVQIPVFIALYWVLLESVEFRQAPFIFWIKDLATADPYYILPVIMGASMYLQQWLSPKPTDPMQAKVMMIMPFAFTLLFMSFPSGLMVYWITNNLLSVLQQWYIIRTIEKKHVKKPAISKDKSTGKAKSLEDKGE